MTMSWPQAFGFAVMCLSVAIAIVGYCRYQYLNDKSYRESLIRIAELESDDK